MGKKGQRLKAKRRRRKAAREANMKTTLLGPAHLGQTQNATHWGFPATMSHNSK